MQPAFEHQLFVDLYEDSVMRTQDWSQKGLRLTVETGIQAWQIKEGYEVQWPTLRYQAVTARVSVVVCASPPARIALLKLSGKELLYVREQTKDQSKLEYVPVWLQASHQKGPPQGLLSAALAAVQNHWGLCRNQRSFGVRAALADVGRIRTLLRPQDATLNDVNRLLVPRQSWVLKGVAPHATAKELSDAVCQHWPIIPLRQLAVKKNRSTWLVESEKDPPKCILASASMITLIEKHNPEQGKPRKHERMKKTTANSQHGSNAASAEMDSSKMMASQHGTATRPFRVQCRKSARPAAEGRSMVRVQVLSSSFYSCTSYRADGVTKAKESGGCHRAH